MKSRTEVYVVDGRLHPVNVERPSGRGRWMLKHSFIEKDLVAIFSGSIDDGDFNIIKIGDKAVNNERLFYDAILMHLGMPPEDISDKVWLGLSSAVLDKVSSIFKESDNRISRQYSRFSNEETATGSFFSNMDCSFEVDGWFFKMTFVEFSKQTKESQTGTDIAIIIDLKNSEGKRSFKTLWMQAKKERRLPKSLVDLPRFQEQQRVSRDFTKDFYALVYTPEGVFVAGEKVDGFMSSYSFIEEAMRCKFGDKSVGNLKNSLNKKKVFKVTGTQID